MSESQVRKYFTDCINIGVLQIIDLHDSYQYLTEYFNAFITDPTMEFAEYKHIVAQPMFLQKFRQDEQEYTIDRNPLNIAEVVVKLAYHFKLIKSNAEIYFNDKERFPEPDEKITEMIQRAGYLTDLLLFLLRIQLCIFYALASKDPDLLKFTKKMYSKSVPTPSEDGETSTIKALLEEKASTDGFINFVVHEAQFRVTSGRKTANVLVFLKELIKKKIFRTYGSFQLDEAEVEEVVLDELCRSTPRGATNTTNNTNSNSSNSSNAVSGVKRARPSVTAGSSSNSSNKKQAGPGGRFVNAAFLANTRNNTTTNNTSNTNNSSTV